MQADFQLWISFRINSVHCIPLMLPFIVCGWQWHIPIRSLHYTITCAIHPHNTRHPPPPFSLHSTSSSPSSCRKQTELTTRVATLITCCWMVWFDGGKQLYSSIRSNAFPSLDTTQHRTALSLELCWHGFFFFFTSKLFHSSFSLAFVAVKYRSIRVIPSINM